MPVQQHHRRAVATVAHQDRRVAEVYPIFLEVFEHAGNSSTDLGNQPSTGSAAYRPGGSQSVSAVIRHVSGVTEATWSRTTAWMSVPGSRVSQSTTTSTGNW